MVGVPQCFEASRRHHLSMPVHDLQVQFKLRSACAPVESVQEKMSIFLLHLEHLLAVWL